MTDTNQAVLSHRNLHISWSSPQIQVRWICASTGCGGVHFFYCHVSAWTGGRKPQLITITGVDGDHLSRLSACKPLLWDKRLYVIRELKKKNMHWMCPGPTFSNVLHAVSKGLWFLICFESWQPCTSEQGLRMRNEIESGHKKALKHFIF